MLAYSYKTQIAGIETQILRLQMDLIKNPNNARAKKLLSQKEQALEWFKSRKDPGVRIL